MKPGDKVWVYRNITQEILEVDVLAISGHRWNPERPSPTVFVRLYPEDKHGTPFWPDFDCFQTRDALCEHYRKIFE